MPSTTDCFRPDNTEGYTLVQLEELNRRYLAATEGAVPLDLEEEDAKDLFDHIAEEVLRTYDTELSGASAGPWTAHDDDGTGTLPCVLSDKVTPYGNFYVAQCNRFEDAKLCAAAPDLADALQALIFAARARDNTMGDPCRLLECKANLASTIKTAESALRKAGRIS